MRRLLQHLFVHASASLLLPFVLPAHCYSLAATHLSGLSPETIQALAENRYGTNAAADGGLQDKVVVITGATGGLGREICRVFSDQLSATVVALDFDERALDSLQEELPTVQTIVADHSDFDSVAAAAKTILNTHDQVDILVNNAGIWYPFDDTQVERAGASAQGYDTLFCINYLSGFLLTELLLPALYTSSDARMIHVVSTKHWQVDGSSILSSNSNNPAASRSGSDRLSTHVEDSYANSKLAQIWHARDLSRRSHDKSLDCLCVCPSWAATGIAGDHPNGEVLAKFAYSTEACGPAVTSLLNAMLRTDDELVTVMGKDATQYVANSNVWKKLLPPWKNVWITSKAVSRWRSTVVAFCTTVVLLAQRWFHDDFILQETSPESCDTEAQEALSKWSYSAIKPWLVGAGSVDGVGSADLISSKAQETT